MQFLVGVRDAKASAFIHFFLVPSEAVGIRTFNEAVTDPKSAIARHPEDYSLWSVAEVDELSGDVREQDGARLLIEGAHLAVIKED